MGKKDRRYKHGGFLKETVTTIIGDCTDKSAPLSQWAANCAVGWIRENLEPETVLSDGWIPTYGDPDNAGCAPMAEPMNAYWVDEEDLNTARFAYKDVSKKALDVGSEVHAAIEKYLLEQMVFPDCGSDDVINGLSTKASKNAFGAFLQWMDEHDVKPIALEQKLYGPTWAGTCDFVGWFDGKVYIIDWKTSAPANATTGKGIRPEMRYQVAAYRWAYAQSIIDMWEGYDTEINKEIYLREFPTGCGVLRIDKKTGEPDWKDTTKTYDKDLKVFNCMVNLYMERHVIIARKAGYVTE